MKELLKGQEGLLNEIFKGCNDTLVWSYLQGHMGQGFVDNIENPKCGRIISNDFCYLCGDSNGSGALELLRQFPKEVDIKELIFMPCGEDWCNFIECNLDVTKKERYAIKKEGDIFNRQLLSSYMDKLPQEYQLRLIDLDLYEKVMQEEWCEDFCSNFKDGEDFVKNGIGVVVLNNEEIIGGASSFSIYDNGIEVEIVTKESYRNQGLATICGAKLILECLKKNKYPSWDAANKVSVKVAEKLGYHFDKSYFVYFHN